MEARETTARVGEPACPGRKPRFSFPEPGAHGDDPAHGPIPSLPSSPADRAGQPRARTRVGTLEIRGRPERDGGRDLMIPPSVDRRINTKRPPQSDAAFQEPPAFPSTTAGRTGESRPSPVVP